MNIDMHIHLPGIQEKNGNYISNTVKKSLLFKYLLKRINIEYDDLNSQNSDKQIQDIFVKLVESSRLDKAVILALDGAYNLEGELQKDETLIITSNNYILETVRKSSKLLFGASIHPYKRDALDELIWAKNNGAVLIKWIPSSMNIDPEHPKCNPFYDFLAEHNMPLLGHTGVEHSLRTNNNNFNHPKKLEAPLKRGVKVIAAHSGAHMFLHEKSYFKLWKEMALKYPHFYGDISAFAIPTRVKYLKEIRKCPELAKKIFYGSDFPALGLPISFIFHIGLKDYLRIKKEENPLNQTCDLFRAFNMPESIFNQFDKILRHS